MRERIVASDGVEAADRALPDWQIEEVASLGQASRRARRWLWKKPGQPRQTKQTKQLETKT